MLYMYFANIIVIQLQKYIILNIRKLVFINSIWNMKKFLLNICQKVYYYKIIFYNILILFQ